MCRRGVSTVKALRRFESTPLLGINRRFCTNIIRMTFKKVTHVIFDMDGLVLDSEKGYDRIMTTIASKFGKQYPLETQIKLLGRTEQDTAKIAVKDLKLPITEDEFLIMYRGLMKIEFRKTSLMPGAERLIRHLHRNSIPIALATSCSSDGVALKTVVHRELFQLFHHKVMGSSDPEVKRGKPFPDIYLICASRFAEKPKAENCLVLEDAPNGVEGARKAGMQTVLVPTDAVNEENRKRATLVLKSLTEFKPEIFGLPPFM